MSSIADLSYATEKFMNLHWPAGYDIPIWSDPWDYITGIPHGNMPGCYAFIGKDDSIIYVGVGASKGSGIYKGFGLAHRINKYKQRVYNESVNFKLIDSLKDVVECIITIGLSDDLYYLSYALEAFLIRELQPEMNVVGRR